MIGKIVGMIGKIVMSTFVTSVFTSWAAIKDRVPTPIKDFIDGVIKDFTKEATKTFWNYCKKILKTDAMDQDNIQSVSQMAQWQAARPRDENTQPFSQQRVVVRLLVGLIVFSVFISGVKEPFQFG